MFRFCPTLVLALWLPAAVAHAEDRPQPNRNQTLPQRCNRALLDRVREHLRSGVRPGAPEAEALNRVLESCRAEDCWEAVRLYAELNGGACPPPHVPSFGTPSGRSLLLRVALDDKELLDDRSRALNLLGQSVNLWPGPGVGPPDVQPLTETEQARLLERLLPLLAVKDERIQAAAARAVREASHPTSTGYRHRQTKTALPRLVAAYRAEPPGAARDALAEAVCLIGGPQHWHDLTGNPPGLLARLHDPQRRDNRLVFWLGLHPAGLKVCECPTLVLEQLNQAGKVIQTKQRPLPVANLPRPWNEGWDGTPLLLVQVPLQELPPGRWRVGVRGTTDGGRMKWSAEPKTFVREDPKKKDQGPTLWDGILR